MNWKMKVDEFFEENYIEMSLQRVLLPLRLMQYITFPKFRISDNFVTCNSSTTNAIWGFSSIIIFTLYFTFTFIPHVRELSKPFRDNLYLISFLIVLLYGIEFVCNVFVTVLQSDINVILLRNYQIIENCLVKANNRYRIDILVNWLYAMIVTVFYLTYSYIQADYVSKPYYIPLVVTVLIVIPSDLNVIYAARMINLLKTQITSWISQLGYISRCNGGLSGNGEEALKTTWRDVVKAYATISDNYLICEKITEVPIILYVYATFVHILTNIQVVIMFAGLREIVVLSLMWTVKNSVLLTIISRECEGVYTSMRNAKITCMLKLHTDTCSDMESAVYKKLRRLIRLQCRPFSAKGFYTVNAALPLQMLSLVATYTVVVLQFNFL